MPWYVVHDIFKSCNSLLVGYILLWNKNTNLTCFFTLSTFSDKGNGKLALICELMDMNLYEMIRGMEALYNIVDMLFYMSFAT